MPRRSGPRGRYRAHWALPAVLVVGGAVLAQEPAATRAALVQLEQAYADFNDAAGAVSLIDSDPARYHAYGGRNRHSWQSEYVARRAHAGDGHRAAAT